MRPLAWLLSQLLVACETTLAEVKRWNLLLESFHSRCFVTAVLSKIELKVTDVCLVLKQDIKLLALTIQNQLRSRTMIICLVRLGTLSDELQIL